MKATIISVCLIFLGSTVLAADKMMGFSGFEHLNTQNKVKVVKQGDHPVREGSKSWVFVLGDGQCKGNPRFDDCGHDRARSQMREKKEPRTGKPIWYAASMFIPSSTVHVKPTNTILLEFQDNKGSGEISLALELIENGLQLIQNDIRVTQTDNMRPPKPLVIKTVVPNSRLKDRWLDVLFHANWSTGADGYVEVYIDGKLVHAHTGPNLEQNRAPKFKFGVYRSFESRYKNKKGTLPTQVVYYDAIARGSSREKVAPN